MLHDSQAIVLAGQKLGEADTLATILTLDHGMLKGVARGARRMKSRFGSALQPFSYGQAIWFETRATALRRINHVDAIHSFQGLREDFDRLSHAAVMANATRRLLPEEQPARETFTALLRAFQALETGAEGERVVLFFLATLTQAAGYQPRLDRCLLGCHPAGEDQEADRWLFIPELGGTVCGACYAHAGAKAHTLRHLPLPAAARAFLRQILRMPSGLRNRVKADPATIHTARLVVESVIAERARRLTKRPVPERTAPAAAKMNVRSEFSV